MEKYTSLEKVLYYPNLFLEPSETVSVSDKDIPADLLSDLESNKCFVFAGNLGTAQALETLLNAAEKIAHLPQCKIILIGSGSMNDWLHQQIRQREIKNISLPGRFQASLMPVIYSRATALLVTLKKMKSFLIQFPVKSKLI